MIVKQGNKLLFMHCERKNILHLPPVVSNVNKYKIEKIIIFYCEKKKIKVKYISKLFFRLHKFVSWLQTDKDTSGMKFNT